MNPFESLGDSANIDVSSSSQRVLVDADGGSSSIRIMNNGTATVWFKFGDANVVASLATSHPIGPGLVEVLTPSVNMNTVPVYAAAIAAGSTGKIYFTPGGGI